MLTLSEIGECFLPKTPGLDIASDEPFVSSDKTPQRFVR
jgi:hypothetical protein